MKLIIVIFSITILIFPIMKGEAQTVQSIKNRDVELNVSIYSPEIEETLILLHGGPGVPDDMREVVDILKDKYRVIVFDQRGTGGSICKNCSFSMEDYISDIDAIRDYLGIDSFHLFGHSWGGLYAQIYLENHPEQIKSLFLCSPSSGTNKTWKQTEKEVMQFNKSHCSTGEWFLMGWRSFLGMMGSDKADRKLFKQVMLNYHKDYIISEPNESFFERIYAKPVNRTRKYILNYRPLSVFENDTIPVLITYGENDIYGDSRKEVYHRFPNAEFKVIERSGHIPWKHNLKTFNEIVKSFYY